MAERIIAGEVTFVCLSAASRSARSWRAFRFTGTQAEAIAAFTSGVIFTREWDSITYDEQGNPTGIEVLTEDLSDYTVLGDVIDHRDGTVTVYIGKKTETELNQEAIAALLLKIFLLGGV